MTADDVRFARGYDPLRADVVDDPFPWYAWLRTQRRAYHVEAHDFYVVSRYDDVCEVTKNHRAFSSTGGVGIAWTTHPMMSQVDPPEHTRLRRIVSKAFLPATVRGLQDAIADETVRRLADVGDGTTDFVAQFAEPLVARVIADLLGLPHELEPNFRRWSLAITGVLAGNLSAAEAEPDRRALVAAMRGLAGTKRGVYALLSDASDAERMSEAELVAFCVLLLIAGFETSVNGLANLIAQLALHPEEAGRLRADPARLTRAIEEALRLDPPDHAFFRNTLEEVTFQDGSVVPPGKKVMVLFASANHDPERFPEPTRFDPDRTNLDHVAFGHGIHYCLGAPLARAMYRTVLDQVLARGAWFELEGDAERTRNSMLRGFHRLPLRFVPAAG